MDRAKKSRKPVRQRVTRLCNEVDAEIATQVPFKDTLVQLIRKLEAAKTELTSKNELVLEAMLDEERDDRDLEDEDGYCQGYFDKIEEALEKARTVVSTSVVIPTSSSSTNNNQSTGGADISVKLPKIELPKFNGEIKDWLSWWAQFEQIHVNCKITETDKFRYLIQCFDKGSKAAQSIEGFQVTPENYPKAIEILKKQFGNPKVLWKYYLRELAKLIQDNGLNKPKTSLFAWYHKLESQLRALESLGTVTRDDFLYPLVETSMPAETFLAWQRSTNYRKDGSKENPPKTELDYLREFLRDEVENENVRIVAETDGGKKKKDESLHVYKNPKNTIPTAASLYVKPEEGKFQPKVECAFCSKQNHTSVECFRASKMSLNEKRQKLKESNACFNCFKKGHGTEKCRNRMTCSFCNGKHYPIMCPEAEKFRSSGSKEEEEKLAEKLKSMAVTPTMTNSSQAKVILMKTLHTRVIGTNGQEREVRMVLDSGSERSYIKSSLAKELKCQVLNQILLQNTLFGGHTTEIKSRQNYKVTVAGIGKDGKRRRDLELINEDVICASCPVIPQGPWIKELARKKIYLTDTYADSNEIEILIGVDLYETLNTGRREILKCGLVASETIFGWTLSGELQERVETSYAATAISLMTYEEKSLPQLWSLETIGITDTAEKISQEEHDATVKEAFQKQITKDEEGRYVVKLPWVAQEVSIPSNRAVAEKRLVQATAKLENQGKFEDYGNIFKAWEKEEIVEDVHVYEKNAESGHFLPHRPVFKPESLTTPVRPVFDASCKVGRNPSLNQCLEKGPNLLELIPSILLRFREKNIGILSDIRKAFQMIGVEEKDRNYQKFLWWEDKQKKIIKEYRHRRVVFGLNCSPFMLAAVLEYHLGQVPEHWKEVAELLKKSLYVDNSVISLDTEEQVEEFKRTSIEIFASAKMDLCQWERSAVEGSKVSSYLECGLVTDGDFDSKGKLTTVLGLRWDKEEDSLFCQLPKKFDNGGVVTKRSVLSTVSQIFDPVGFTCPAILQPKLMLQESWAVEVSWDQEWKSEEQQKFKKWCGQIEDLGRIHIPRNAFGKGTRVKIQLHCFSDASKVAYATVVFARVQDQDQVSVQLLMAKSRLAPLDKKKKKAVTIPRLELLGCLIGSRLMSLIREALSAEEVPAYYWSDSTTALAWIRRDGDWGTFVGNRVREINKLTQISQWRHVPGILNPADLPSRGCSPSELVESRWWEGPAWLKQDENFWPGPEEDIVNEEEVAEEQRKTVPVLSIVPRVIEPRFSSFLKNVLVAGWMRRFIENTRKKVKENRATSKYLSLEEIRAGERDILYEMQQNHFPNGPNVKNLHLYSKKDGLWRVETRLTYRDDTDDFKSPVLLPKDDALVSQLIEYVHRIYCHAGAQFVLGKLREKYWIVHGRKSVNRVIHKCVICRRHAAKATTGEPAPLPLSRIEMGFAFQTTGVDLAGPIVLKGGKKAWIVLYTCAVYRGVYLDVVDSLSADEFLDSLEKFTNLIGRPNRVFSDNGTNFVGAQNLMKKLAWEKNKLEDKLHVKQIVWTFNPPSAPWWGGWWERLVRTLKDLLKRMIARAKLTRKQLVSCLASISYTVNNRPLTTLTEDEDDLIPLTPAMFMKDLPVSGLPERELITGKDLQESYAKINSLKKALRERFRKEYLAELVQRKNEKKSSPPEVGDVVLVGQENKKRFEWPLGRILELHPGKDGKVRVARVKTANGILLRPIQRLYPLEVPNPKLIDVDTRVRSLAKETKATQDKEIEKAEVPVVKTRSGREIRKPSRYGQWNN